MDSKYLELQEAIEGLYGAFMRYKLAPIVHGCPHCVSGDDERGLRAAPLRALDGFALSKYAWKAMTTWGDANDFRFFLPRLFELAALDPDAYSQNIQVLFGKLRHAKWETWPAREQEAIRKYLSALWNATLSGEIEPYEVEERLCCLACTSDDIEPILQAWVEPPQAHKLRLMAGWLLSGGALGDAFWYPEPRSRARAWLLDPSTSQGLEDIFFAGDAQVQAAASGALDGLALLSHRPWKRRG